MKRAEATKRLLTVVERAAVGGELCELVDEIHVFGSYAHGAREPGDLDVSVSYKTTEAESRKWVAALFAGRDRTLDLRRALRGSWRSVEMHFNNVNDLRLAGFEPVLVWRRGEPVERARERLAAIPEDPAAGSADRDPVIPALVGLDRYVPRPLREQLALLDHLGLARVERVELDDAEPNTELVRRRIEGRWSETNPKIRAVRAAAAWLERRGYRPDIVGNNLCSDETNPAEYNREVAKAVCYFGGRWIEDAAGMLGTGSDEALVILNQASRKARLIGLQIMRAAPPEQVEQVVYAIEYGGDARRTLLGQLVREHSEGKLPETLHDFIETLMAAAAERERAG
jgi:hypothetical protein